MSKIINSTVQASIDSGTLAGVLLVRMHFSPILRYTNAYQSVYWDEAGGGDLEYTGIGNLGAISALTETSELSAQTIQLSLSGIPSAMITDIFSDEYINNPVYIWYATLDKSTYAVEGGQTGPVLIFAGRMDYGVIEFGQTATITLNATSRLADWERPRGGRYNLSYQQRNIDETCTGFKYIQALQNKPITWGGVSLLDSGTGGGSSDERNPNNER